MMITMLMAAALSQAAGSMPAQRPRMDRGAHFDRMFQMADTDRNGQLSRAELQAAREKMRAHRMQRRANAGGRMGGWGGAGGKGRPAQ